ncbi:oxysterol-binding protein-related protein 4C-like isoform X2 [Hibiscus syriacus]|uniref:Oxysterol-binding protein-related protein 4C-like isoform X2 n=1 Tax=Hibiscus syriacus TaxID=106335 RepID=A0A6A2WV05_HIBSY|nr:oxysterol-binding protein-related protein 4C-like isoform X2 [Hibiscus syriacus]
MGRKRNDVGEGLEEESSSMGYNNGGNPSFSLLLEQDLFWEDEELHSLFTKETEQQPPCFDVGIAEYLAMVRREALEWTIKVNARYRFTTHTAVLSINYLDRFLCIFEFQSDKPWMIQLSRSKEDIKVVLTKPLSIDGESEADYRAPNLIQRTLSLFKNVRPGSDLTHFKSHLQCYGEQVYCTGADMLLTRCNVPDNPLERFLSVVAFSISASRPLVFGVVPFNLVLGETHHVSRATLNVVLEQEHNIELIWCQQCISKFTGASVDVKVRGKRQLKLSSRGETYEMNSPNLLIRFLPLPGADWAGNVGVGCKETEFEAELQYGPKSFLGLRRSHRSLKGKIFETSTKRILFELDGHWDRTVTVKDNNSGELRVIYNAEEKVKEAKNAVKENQREASRGMESKGKTWVPQHFSLSYSKVSGSVHLLNNGFHLLLLLFLLYSFITPSFTPLKKASPGISFALVLLPSSDSIESQVRIEIHHFGDDGIFAMQSSPMNSSFYSYSQNDRPNIPLPSPQTSQWAFSGILFHPWTTIGYANQSSLDQGVMDDDIGGTAGQVEVGKKEMANVSDEAKDETPGFTVYVDQMPTSMEEVITDLEAQFMPVCDAENEVSVMLEANRVQYSSS